MSGRLNWPDCAVVTFLYSNPASLIFISTNAFSFSSRELLLIRLNVTDVVFITVVLFQSAETSFEDMLLVEPLISLLSEKL